MDVLFGFWADDDDDCFSTEFLLDEDEVDDEEDDEALLDDDALAWGPFRKLAALDVVCACLLDEEEGDWFGCPWWLLLFWLEEDLFNETLAPPPVVWWWWIWWCDFLCKFELGVVGGGCCIFVLIKFNVLLLLDDGGHVDDAFEAVEEVGDEGDDIDEVDDDEEDDDEDGVGFDILLAIKMPLLPPPPPPPPPPSPLPVPFNGRGIVSFDVLGDFFFSSNSNETS